MYHLLSKCIIIYKSQYQLLDQYDNNLLKPILIKITKKVSHISGKLEFIPTRTGYLLLLDGYTYWKDARNKCAIYWYCSKRHQKCPAFVKTDHGHTTVLASATYHNHERRVGMYVKTKYSNMVY